MNNLRKLSFVLLAFVIFACQTPLLAAPTATPTATLVPTATATLTPTATSTPKPTNTATPNPLLECKNRETQVYVAQANIIWGQFRTIDKQLTKNFNKDGSLKNTTGFSKAIGQVGSLADAQAKLTQPGIFKEYNDLAVNTMQTYSKVLVDLNSGDMVSATVDAAALRTYWKGSDDAWQKVWDSCGFPTPSGSPSS